MPKHLLQMITVIDSRIFHEYWTELQAHVLSAKQILNILLNIRYIYVFSIHTYYAYILSAAMREVYHLDR